MASGFSASFARLRPAAVLSLVARRGLASNAAAATTTGERINYPGATRSVFTKDMAFEKHATSIPTYRVMDREGQMIDPKQDPKLAPEILLKMYRGMVTLNTMDDILYNAQRQGRISFYMTNYGEEATHFGSSAALDLEDHVFGQYREAGVLMWRGFTLDDFMNQCYSNELDPGKGRQMPVHYGSRLLNFQTISSPLATQIPQAAGAAYALKRAGKNNVVITYFGEGAASEGDFHAALNVAATTDSPVLFFCRNNGFAISTPVEDQYRGDGIASRGAGYGIDSIRVDGNDIFAVYNVVKAAREIALTKHKPILIEAMTYRVGHHSTSDDSTSYRPAKDATTWNERDNPITRFRRYLEHNNHWSKAMDDEFRADIKKKILESFSKAEKRLKPAISELFTDVYDTLPKVLLEQQQEMLQQIAKYPSEYPTKNYSQSVHSNPHSDPKEYL